LREGDRTLHRRGEPSDELAMPVSNERLRAQEGQHDQQDPGKNADDRDNDTQCPQSNAQNPAQQRNRTRDAANYAEDQADDAQCAEDDHGLIGVAANGGIAPLNKKKNQAGNPPQNIAERALKPFVYAQHGGTRI
jgi:hypothetical protein